MSCDPVVCDLCGEIILEVRDTVWYVDKKTKTIVTRHKNDCQDIEKSSPDFYMKRVGQVKHD